MTIFIILFSIIFTWGNWKYFPYPYIGEALLLAVICLYAYFKTSRAIIKIGLINLAILLICLGLLEIWSAVSQVPYVNHERFGGDYVQDSFIPDDNFGYVPKKNIRIASQKYYDNQMLYNVVYTINKDGLRISPLCEGSGCKEVTLFFGCSITYGEGLNDNEAMPFLVGEFTKTKIYNFAYSGYGPHQMLRAIEHGTVRNIVDGNPRYAILSTGPFHIQRTAGYDSWEEHDPKYILNKEGKLEYAGHFDDKPRNPIIEGLIEKSATYQYFIKGRVNVSAYDVKRYIAIIIAAKKELLKEFPGIEFHIIYWYWGDLTGQDKMLLEAFQKEGIKTHLITDILPKFREGNLDYQLGIHELHPNFNANMLIAKYIVKNILHQSIQSVLSSDR